ncbi:MAG: pyridoxamine 5'-phosphate oxidase [Thiomicrorhabdus sp.]|nr:pyridoxamine 5'-phosphate oxidase [Thiomicrorhabdus sp.]
MSKAFKDLADMRQSYQKGGLNENEVCSNPIEQFNQWFEEAKTADLTEPNAMVLATVSPELQPTTRTVLLKYFDNTGFVFFTNYTSEKSKHIEQNPNVSLQFLWLDLERQVRIEGRAEKISTAESIKYFSRRPKGSQIGAWVSHQSEIISSKSLLKAQYEKLITKFKDSNVPFPDFWGGYRVVPNKIEFWQGGENRLHDRIVYQKSNQAWSISRLAP